MLEDMLDSMPKRDGMPLFLHPSARDSNPDLRPSKDQSIFFVCTREEFFRLPPQTQYLIHRHRCVVMINIGADPPPPFDQSTLGRFRNPRDLCPIQGKLIFRRCLVVHVNLYPRYGIGQHEKRRLSPVCATHRATTQRKPPGAQRSASSHA